MLSEVCDEQHAINRRTRDGRGWNWKGALARRLIGNLEACEMELAPKPFFNGGRTVAKKAAKKAPKKAAKKSAKKKKK